MVSIQLNEEGCKDHGCQGNNGSWNAARVRKAFVDYFQQLQHTAVPSSPLVLFNDPTLMFTNSGMVQFKDTFAGTEKRSYSRAVSVQKCLRVSGKHNDLEDVGRTRRHHTFFEMLGNFSFGDYFKIDAIVYAWRFVTEVLCLPKSKLWVTVHEGDDEALQFWREHTDVNPERLVKLGDKTNLWSMGEVGPWGYCSEIFFYQGDQPEAQSLQEFLKDDGTYLEIWNLVFMQYYRDEGGNVTSLPLQCIDTGMGLERVTTILEQKKATYDSSAFRGLISEVEKITGIRYVGDCYKGEPERSNYASDVSMRVIADHVRAAAFLISDGIVPANEGHSYILRRILRRAIRHGLKLGIEKKFMSLIAKNLITDMGAAYPELNVHAASIVELIDREEEQFRRTVKDGLTLLERWIAQNNNTNIIDGKVAFQLYDTFGFPLDLTEDIASEHGYQVDVAEFDNQMAEQRARSRAAAPKAQILMPQSIESSNSFGTHEVRFVGYEELSVESKILSLIPIPDKTRLGIVVGETPFYAEMGGQVGDKGLIRCGDLELRVIDTYKNGQYVHIVDVAPFYRPGNYFEELSSTTVGKSCQLEVDPIIRGNIQRHHSATHLLHYALRRVLGEHVAQRGSLVQPDRLRFDFSHHRAPSKDELYEVMRLVNDLVCSNVSVETEEVSYQEAIKKGALAFFGDKYGDQVRVVTIGDASVELCGGTHVRQSGDIGGIVILSEGSISAGVRRIEMAVGQAAIAETWRQGLVIHDMCSVLKANEGNVLEKLNRSLDSISEVRGDLKKLQNQFVVHLAESLIGTKRDRIYAEFNGLGREILQGVADKFLSSSINKGGLVVLYDTVEKLWLLKSTDTQFNCGAFVSDVRTKYGLKGGGNASSASLLGVSHDVAISLCRELALN